MIQFKGIKQVTLDKYKSDEDKLGYLFLVRDFNPDNSVKSEEIYFGGRKYGDSSLEIVNEIIESFGGLLTSKGEFNFPAGITWESFKDENVESLAGLLSALDKAIKANANKFNSYYTKGEVDGIKTTLQNAINACLTGVSVKVGTETYNGEVVNGVATVDLSDAFEAAGKVKDVTIDGKSVVNTETGVAEIEIPEVDVPFKTVKSDDKVLTLSTSGELSSNLSYARETIDKVDSLVLRGVNNEVIGSVPVADFVADGMLTKVEEIGESGNFRFTFNVNKDGVEGEDYFDVDFSKFVDTYHADGTTISLENNTFSVKEVAATKTKTVDAIPVAGGPLESLLKGAGINEIAAGTSIEDVLFSLICKELWASELTFSEGTVASSIAKPSFTLTKDGSNVSGTVEIGTKVVLSDITMSAATPSISKNRTYSGFTYGYSAENDNTQDSTDTSITAGVDKAVALNEGNYTMSRDYTGFNRASDDSATANADASKVTLSGAELVVGDGTNKVKVTVGGPTASATFAAMPVYYACSNLKKTKDADKDTEGQYKSVAKDANTVTSGNASNNRELSVTGKRYMFWGAHAEHKTLNSAIIREHANGGTTSTQAKTVTITIPESGVNQFYVALPSGRSLTKVYNTAAGEQFGEVTDSFSSSTIEVEGAEGYTAANYTVWTFNSGTAWVGPNTLTVIIG